MLLLLLLPILRRMEGFYLKDCSEQDLEVARVAGSDSRSKTVVAQLSLPLVRSMISSGPTGSELCRMYHNIGTGSAEDEAYSRS